MRLLPDVMRCRALASGFTRTSAFSNPFLPGFTREAKRSRAFVQESFCGSVRGREPNASSSFDFKFLNPALPDLDSRPRRNLKKLRQIPLGGEGQ
jgi:hypothetical protein